MKQNVLNSLCKFQPINPQIGKHCHLSNLILKKCEQNNMYCIYTYHVRTKFLTCFTAFKLRS